MSIMDINDIDNELLNILQSNFPVEDSPFLKIGKQLNISESEVIERISNLKKIKYIDRLVLFLIHEA